MCVFTYQPLKKTQEESNATVRMILKKEALAIAEAYTAKKKLEEEKLRIEAEEERKRIEKEKELKRQAKMKKDEEAKQKVEKARLDKLKLEKEEKVSFYMFGKMK